MQYGKPDTFEGLPDGWWELPPDGPSVGGAAGECAVRTGGTMWTIDAWRGSVYPAKATKKTWPGLYGRAFGTLELNATHYRIHPPERMAAWAEQMPEDFRFCAKFPQIISHFRRFRGCEGPTDDFIAGLLALGARRGPAFIQLPPHFGPDHGAALVDYLAAWPRELAVAVEFRHPGWFAGGAAAEEVWAALAEWGVSAVISDTALRRDAVHMRRTGPAVLVRFGGGDGHPSDAPRLEAWADRCARWAESGCREFYFLVHQPDSLNTPETCRRFAAACHRRSPAAPAIRTPQLAENLFTESGQTA